MHLFRRLRESHSRYGRADRPVLVAMLAFGFYWLATKDRPTSPKTRSTLSIVLRDHPWMGLRTLHHDHALDALRDPTSVSSKHAMPHRSPFAYGACIVALVALLTAVCWMKGEKPRWRWGKDD